MNNNIFCWNCGKQNDCNVKFCAYCGSIINNSFTSATSPNINQYNSSSLSCPNCGSHNVQVQIISENKEIGCGTILLCIIFAWTIIGLILLIKILSNNKVNRKYFVCQNCGETFDLTHNNLSNDDTIGNIIAFIIIILGIGFILYYIFW